MAAYEPDLEDLEENVARGPGGYGRGCLWGAGRVDGRRIDPLLGWQWGHQGWNSWTRLKAQAALSLEDAKLRLGEEHPTGQRPGITLQQATGIPHCNPSLF